MSPAEKKEQDENEADTVDIAVNGQLFQLRHNDVIVNLVSDAVKSV